MSNALDDLLMRSPDVNEDRFSGDSTGSESGASAPSQGSFDDDAAGSGRRGMQSGGDIGSEGDGLEDDEMSEEEEDDGMEDFGEGEMMVRDDGGQAPLSPQLDPNTPAGPTSRDQGPTFPVEPSQRLTTGYQQLASGSNTNATASSSSELFYRKVPIGPGPSASTSGNRSGGGGGKGIPSFGGQRNSKRSRNRGGGRETQYAGSSGVSGDIGGAAKPSDMIDPATGVQGQRHGQGKVFNKAEKDKVHLLDEGMVMTWDRDIGDIFYATPTYVHRPASTTEQTAAQAGPNNPATQTNGNASGTVAVNQTQARNHSQDRTADESIMTPGPNRNTQVDTVPLDGKVAIDGANDLTSASIVGSIPKWDSPMETETPTTTESAEMAPAGQPASDVKSDDSTGGA